MATIRQALAKLRKLGEQRDPPLPEVDEVKIAAAEKKLACKFPPSYRIFLKESREHGLQFEEFLWIGSRKALDETNAEHLVDVNLEERADGSLPAFLVSFLSDGNGTQICLDTRFPRANGEFPVVEWERGAQLSEADENRIEQAAKDFPTWLVETLEREQEESPDDTD